MDGQRFDELTRALATGVSRRGVLRGLGGGLAALAAAALGRGAGAAPKDKPGATPKFKRCNVGCASLKGQQKNACMKACRECGGDFDRVCVEEGPFGPVAFTCCPPGTFCVFGAGICCPEGGDVCFDPETGEPTCCPAGTLCDFETGACVPPVECGPDAGCLGGPCAPGCFCLSSVEGEAACVFFGICDGAPCETSADCAEGELCVDVSEEQCCGEGPFQGVCQPVEARCDAGGAPTGAAARRTTPWRRPERRRRQA